MKGELLRRSRGWQHAVRLVAASLVVAGSGVVGGCLTRPLQPQTTNTTSTVVERLAESAVDKIDLLFMVDNSRSMADKQTALAMTLPDLVRGLVNPNCVDMNGNPAPPASQPAGPLDACPDPTTKRDFTPIVDIHIGVVTSSLGGHGSDACPDSETFSCPGGATNTTNNDHGHLVSRLDSCTGGSAPTYQGQGYLAWDPTGQKDNPPGESNIGSVNIDLTTGAVTTATPGLVANLKDMVIGTGQLGCGYEAQMEGWYRFLVDPDPPTTLQINTAGDVVRVGIDNTLLQQRADFLRPDSLLAIIAVTDENDASVKEYGQFYLVYQQRNPSNPNENFHLPSARQECLTNPLDPCCRSCGQSQAGCPTDPTCTTLTDSNDDVNLREWHQKERFGIDFYYPYTRYVEALTQPLVANNAGEMVANPIFTNLNPSNNTANVRDASLVFLACITGVPWQDIAVDPTDLTQGYKTPTQMAQIDKNGHTTWDYIMGKSQYPVSTTDPNAPLDPHMYEDDKPRTGTDPITGATLAPPSMTEGGSDPINGHEYTPGTVNGVQNHPDDIEYACIFKLPAPRDCSDPTQTSCDCTDPMNDNALCAADPAHNGNRTLQTHAKAYPAIREMFILHDLGNQGIVASICPSQLTNDDPSAADFGYRPAVAGIITRLKAALGGQCLPRQLTPNAEGEVQCLVLEAINSNGKDAGTSGLGYGGACDAYCNSQSARQAVQPEHYPAVQAALEDPTSKNSDFDCFCEIQQLSVPAGTKNSSVCTQGAASSSALQACECDPSDPPLFGGSQVNGWCYVDATVVPNVGNATIVKNCPDSEKRLVRFVGNGNPKPGGVLFITCAGD